VLWHGLWANHSCWKGAVRHCDLTSS